MVEYPLFLAAVLAAFAVFGVTLAYVNHIAARRPDGTPAE